MKKNLDVKLTQTIDGKIRATLTEIAPQERSTMGLCFYCGLDVFAGPGQAIKHLIRETPSGRHQYPTHKACRKGKK